METIIGIDPGYRNVGWAILQQDESRSYGTPTIIDAGSIETEGKEIAVCLDEIDRDMTELLQLFSVTSSAIETPFFDRNIPTAGNVHQAAGIITLHLFRATQKPPIALHQAQWKSWCGSGRASKSDIKDFVRSIFDWDCHTDHESDAIAIAYAALLGARSNIH